MSSGPGNAIHVIRSYLPALGFIALLAAWPLERLLRTGTRAGTVTVAGLLAALILAGGWSYQELVTDGSGPRSGPARALAGRPPAASPGAGARPGSGATGPAEIPGIGTSPGSGPAGATGTAG